MNGGVREEESEDREGTDGEKETITEAERGKKKIKEESVTKRKEGAKD